MNAKVVVSFCCLVAAMLPLAGCGRPKLSPADQVAADAELFKAVKLGSVQSAREWLNKGANVNTAGGDGWSPLHLAARAGHKDIAELLIVKGANVNAVDRSGQPPLYWAELRDHKDVEEILRRHGAK